MPPLYEAKDQENGAALGGGVIVEPGKTINLPESVGDACPALRLADEKEEDAVPVGPNDDFTGGGLDSPAIAEPVKEENIDTEAPTEAVGDETCDDTSDETPAPVSAEAEPIQAPSENPDDLTELPGIGEAGQKRLNELGLFTYAQVAAADVEVISSISLRITKGKAKKIKEAAAAKAG